MLIFSVIAICNVIVEVINNPISRAKIQLIGLFFCYKSYSKIFLVAVINNSDGKDYC
jgi:hypothetical protein